MRIRVVALLSVACAATAFAAETPADAPAPRTLSCDAPFNKDTTETALIAAFGAENVEYKTVPGAEGMETNATVIFPNDPAKMLTVFWWDEDKRARPAAVTVQADFSAYPEDFNPWTRDIQWRTSEGLAIGSDIAAVEKANGKAFKISGFGWDYGGYAISWENGALDAEARNGCFLLMRFAPSADPIPDSAQGDVELLSDSTEIAAAKPRVTEFSVSYPSD